VEILITNFRPIDAAKNLLIDILFNFGLIKKKSDGTKVDELILPPKKRV
jgi:hypothetical protein